MFEEIKLYLFIFLFFSSGFLFYGLYKLPAGIRIIRMKKLAKKYQLKYQRIQGLIKFEALPSGKEKRNIISGIINGNKIKIYDYIGYSHLLERGHVFKEHHTVFIKNNKTSDIKGVAGYVRIGTIKKWIDAIIKNQTYQIQEPHKFFLKYSLYFLLFLAIIILAIDPKLYIFIGEGLFEGFKESISKSWFNFFKFIVILIIIIKAFNKIILKYIKKFKK